MKLCERRSHAVEVISGVGRMSGQVVALSSVEDLGAICHNRPALAADLVAAAAASGKVFINVCEGRQHLLGVGHICVGHSFCVVLHHKAQLTGSSIAEETT